jgi:hypothetical protein
MAKFTVMDFPKVELKVSGLKMVQPPSLSFKVEIELPKEIEKSAAKDPLVLQEFKNQAKDILDQTVKTIEQKCKVFDNLFVQMATKGATDKDMEKQLKGLNDAIKNDLKVAEKAAEMGVMKTWSELQSKRKEWKVFKIKIFASIAGTVAGLAVSIAAMASSPFSGGAGAAFAIIGFVKSGVSLATDISKLAMDIDTAKSIVVKNLAVVEKAASNKALNALNEVTAAVFQEFLGISQPSVKTCEGAGETLKAKYAQMIVKVHDLSKTLEKILGQQEKLKKEFLAEAGKRLKDHPTPNKAGELKKIEANLDDALAPNYKKVDNAIKKVTEMYQETRTWAPSVKELTDRIASLSLNDPKGLKVFREGLKFASLALAPLDGNGIATTAKDLGLGIGGAVGGYAYDKICSKAIDGTVFDV